MVPSRNGPRGAEVASFGLGILVFFLTPTQVGYQDLAALIAQQPAVAARWREHQIGSPFGTIHAATFSLPRPVGTNIPESPMVRLASLGAGDVTGAIGSAYAARRPQQVVFPEINRTNKGDRLVPSTPAPSEPAGDDANTTPAEAPKPAITPSRPKAAEAPAETPAEIDHTDSELPDAQSVVLAEIARDAHRRVGPAGKPDEIAAAMHFEPFAEYDISLSLELDPKIVIEEPADLADIDPTQFTPNAPPSLEGLNDDREGDAALFRQRPVRHQPRRHPALGERRGAGARPCRPGFQAERSRPRDRAAGHDDCRQGRSDRRRPAPEDARPSGSALPVRSAPRRKSASPTRSISNRAASRCAGRSRSRRW